ncbi:MAG: hypothetical protein AAGO57_07270 [Pseudomonadota bacterium]
MKMRLIIGIALLVLAIPIGVGAAIVWEKVFPTPPLGEDEGLAYYGAEATIKAEPGAAPAAIKRATDALAEATYFGAYAEGPGGAAGLWIGAHSQEGARAYALANCGTACVLVAELVPSTADPNFGAQVATPAIAIAAKRRINRGDFIAFGGANAWGMAVDPAGRTPASRGRKRAVEECRARLAEEPKLAGVDLPECSVTTYLGIHDRRPKPELYPADFTVDLTELQPTGFVLEKRDLPRATSLAGLFAAINPKGLHGASAKSSDGASGRARSAGWPAAGEDMALLMCDGRRKFGDAMCLVSKSMVPDQELADGVLAVTPELYASFQAWQETGGAGAFAISPFGAWGSSYDMPDTKAALQKAADWCKYYGRRSRTEFDFDHDFIDVKIPCRVVAVREAYSPAQFD